MLSVLTLYSGPTDNYAAYSDGGKYGVSGSYSGVVMTAFATSGYNYCDSACS